MYVCGVVCLIVICISETFIWPQNSINKPRFQLNDLYYFSPSSSSSFFIMSMCMCVCVCIFLWLSRVRVFVFTSNANTCLVCSYSCMYLCFCFFFWRDFYLVGPAAPNTTDIRTQSHKDTRYRHDQQVIAADPKQPQQHHHFATFYTISISFGCYLVFFSVFLFFVAKQFLSFGHEPLDCFLVFVFFLLDMLNIGKMFTCISPSKQQDFWPYFLYLYLRSENKMLVHARACFFMGIQPCGWISVGKGLHNMSVSSSCFFG